MLVNDEGKWRCQGHYDARAKGRQDQEGNTLELNDEEFYVTD